MFLANWNPSPDQMHPYTFGPGLVDIYHHTCSENINGSHLAYGGDTDRLSLKISMWKLKPYSVSQYNNLWLILSYFANGDIGSHHRPDFSGQETHSTIYKKEDLCDSSWPHATRSYTTMPLETTLHQVLAFSPTSQAFLLIFFSFFFPLLSLSFSKNFLCSSALIPLIF